VTDVDTSVTGAHRADFLAGVRVLELGDGVAGSAATNVLWALGAEITVVIDPASPHRRGRPHLERDGRRTSLLSIVLDRGKRLLTLENCAELEGMLAHGDTDGAAFDVVVVDRLGGARGLLASLHDVGRYAEFVEQHNPAAWVTISAFGLSGARAEDVATELTVAAAGGMLASVRDERTGQPLKVAGHQSLLNTGQAGALAACHAIDLARSGAVHLDLSAVEATIAMGPTLEVGNLLLETGSPGGAKRYGAPASFYECADGFVRVSAMEDHQWQGVVDAMGSREWAERFASVEARMEAADDVDARVAEWTRSLTKGEAETLLQAHGVPATAMCSPAELLESRQLAHRDAFERVRVADDRDATVVGLPFRVVAGGNDDPGAGARRRRSLRGLRMLEASHVLAAPLAGAVLGALGVEVTKLEDLRRMDMYRRRGPYIDGTDGMERSAYFALVNHSKRSAAFDVNGEPEQLDALLEHSDVVVENLGRKRASELGVAASVAAEDHPDLLAVSSSGFGQDGPNAAYRAYAYNLQAACGLCYLTRNEDGEPAEIDIAWADLISAYALATIVAAWAVGPSGNSGVGVDFAMSDLVVAHFNEFLAIASLDRDSEQSVDRANELSPYAPHGVYRTADGWLALSVEDHAQFEHLAELLDHDLLTDSAFATADGRFEERGTLDGRVAQAVRTRIASELAAELRALGVPAEEVRSPADLLSEPQLAARGFLTPVEHPEWGRRRLVGLPWRRFGGPAVALGPPPVLGHASGRAVAADV
jgi:crotonobetainyl-CoA:carnitine CoA-transferase CaiB-like acyl-CoA transferase